MSERDRTPESLCPTLTSHRDKGVWGMSFQLTVEKSKQEGKLEFQAWVAEVIAQGKR